MKDSSGNENKNKIKILQDISYNFIINPLFLALEDCSNNTNNFYNKKIKKINLKNDIKIINNSFNMRLETILDKIKEQRKNNNNNNYNYKNMRKNLDNKFYQSDNLYINPLNKKNYRRKRLLDALIDNINLDYNKINDEKRPPPPPSRKIFNFNRPRKAPPPPPPSFFSRRKSIYIPPKSKEDIIKDGKEELPEKKKTLVNIERTIDSLEDLLKLIDDYPLKDDIEYNIDMESIHNIKNPLENLNKMIGMNNLKNNIVDQIIYFIQKLHLTEHTKNGDFMHTVIYGPPGTGKTEIAKIIGTIFSGLGVLSKNTFRKATRADFIAGYLGQTALKTKDLVKECLGGVLFIDEAYSLGNPEKRDSFAKECIDTLCEALSDNKENLMVIIAGYEEDLDRCFFAYNQGLNSRFPWRFKTDDYKAEELKKIFEKKVHDISWSFIEKPETLWFENNMDYFKFYGRDMETLFSKTKIAHSRRVFCKPKKEKTKLTINDIQKGFDMFIDNNEVKSRKDNVSNIKEFMYI